MARVSLLATAVVSAGNTAKIIEERQGAPAVLLNQKTKQCFTLSTMRQQHHMALGAQSGNLRFLRYSMHVS